MIKKTPTVFFPLMMALFLVFSLPLQSRGADIPFSVGLGFDYASGDYDTGEDTDSYSVPLIVDVYPTDRLDFELVVPYVHQSSSTTVSSGRQRFSVERPMEGTMGPGGGTRTFDADNSESGLGDITLTGGYILKQETATTPRVRPYLYLKFPTADEDDGLGTGEFDLGPGLELSKWLDGWYASVNAAYIFQGDNDDFDLKDYLTFGAELGNQITDRFLPSVSIWGATPPSDESPTLLEARLNGTYWASEEWSLEGYLATGLTDGSPDYGAGLAIFRHF